MLQKEARALEQSITNRLMQMVEANNRSQVTAFEPTHTTLLIWVVAMAVVLRLLAPYLLAVMNKLHDRWFPYTFARTDNRAEKLFVERFAQAARVDLAPAAPQPFMAEDLPSCRPPQQRPPSPGNPLTDFFAVARRDLAAMRRTLANLNTAGEAEQSGKCLGELLQLVQAFKAKAALPEIQPVWQLAFTIEGLLVQLLERPQKASPGHLRLVVSAVDLLHSLCVPGVRPDLLMDPPVRLLAVDDDAICRHAVAIALKKSICLPDVASTSAEGFELAERTAYDAILLDVEMPETNGFELCAQIHGTEANQTTPVIFVTRFSDLDSRAKSCLTGGEDLIGKPFLLYELALKALTCVMRRRLQGGPRVSQTLRAEVAGVR